MIMGFFHFLQNNSGGKFIFDATRGLSVHVIVEGSDIDEVNFRANEIGIYFDGCDDGIDSDCCGDRWYRPIGELDCKPMVYDDPVKGNDPWPKGGPRRWVKEGFPAGYIHYKCGTISPFWI